MDFFEIIKLIEAKLADKGLSFELWDMQYAKYVFGSWYVDYRISGHHVMFIYDGRETVWAIRASEKYADYPPAEWQDVFYGPYDKFKAEGFDGLGLFLATNGGKS